MQWKVTVAPDAKPITSAQVLAQARIDDADSNATWITDAIADATEYSQTATQLSLITQTIEAVYYPDADNVPASAAPFPVYAQLQLFRGPVQSITSVKDRAGNDVSYDRRKVGRVEFIQLLTSALAPVTVTYVAGFGDAAGDVPSDIRRAILAHVAHMWKFREADADSVPTGLKFIYDKYQVGGMG